ncbi:hypothetical protein FB639_004379 [Coemansia asiatica]|nr:hypothetical protein FB639_004379 [Coemansia asiatica]
MGTYEIDVQGYLREQLKDRVRNLVYGWEEYEIPLTHDDITTVFSQLAMEEEPSMVKTLDIGLEQKEQIRVLKAEMAKLRDLNNKKKEAQEQIKMHEEAIKQLELDICNLENDVKEQAEVIHNAQMAAADKLKSGELGRTIERAQKMARQVLIRYEN